MDDQSIPKAFSNIAASAASHSNSPAPGDAGATGALKSGNLWRAEEIGSGAGTLESEDLVEEVESLFFLCTTAEKDFREGGCGVRDNSWNSGPASAAVTVFLRNLGANSPIGFTSGDDSGCVVGGIDGIVSAVGDGAAEVGADMRIGFVE